MDWVLVSSGTDYIGIQPVKVLIDNGVCLEMPGLDKRFMEYLTQLNESNELRQG